MSVSPRVVQLQAGMSTVVNLRGTNLNTIKRGALYRDKAGKARVRDLKVAYTGGGKSGRLSITLAGTVNPGRYYVRLSDAQGRSTSLLPVKATVARRLAAAPKTQKQSADTRKKTTSARPGQASGLRSGTLTSDTMRGPAPEPEKLEEESQSDTEKAEAIISSMGNRPGTTGVTNTQGAKDGNSRQTTFAPSTDSINEAGAQLQASVTSPGSEASSNEPASEGLLTNPDESRKRTSRADRQARITRGLTQTPATGTNLGQLASQSDASGTGPQTGKDGIADGTDGDSSGAASTVGTAVNTVVVLAKGAGKVAKIGGRVSLAADVVDLAPKLAEDYKNDTADIKTGISLVSAVTGASAGAMIGGPAGAVVGAVVGLVGTAVGSLFDMPCQDCDWEKNYVEEQKRRKADPNYARLQDYIFRTRLIKGNITPANYEIESETRAGSMDEYRSGFVNPGSDGAINTGEINTPRPPGQTGGNIDPSDDTVISYADNTRPGQGMPQYSAARPQGTVNINTGNTRMSRQEFRRMVWMQGKKIMIARVQDLQRKKNIPEDEVKFFISEVNRMSQADFEATKNGQSNWARKFADRYVERFGDRLKSENRRK